MDLRWWPIAAAGGVALFVVVAVALVAPLPGVRRVLRPLANVTRLTALPEYARVARARFWSLLLTGVLLGLLFAAALIAAARPVGFASATRNFEALHPEDIMVCVGEPVTDGATAGLLDYFAQRMKAYDTQRVGLTSPTLRVVPLTRDYDYAAKQFTDYAALSSLQASIDGGKKLAEKETTQLRDGIDRFSRTIDYTDYAPSVEDILALCMTGFPSFEDKSIHRRALIYAGYSNIRSAADHRRSLFSTQDVKNLAAKAGIQINAIARTDVVTAENQKSDSLSSIVSATGGRFSVYNPAGTGVDLNGGTDATQAKLLDRIAENPPNVVLPNGTMITHRTWDYPNLPLSVSLAVAVLLCASLAVLRR